MRWPRRAPFLHPEAPKNQHFSYLMDSWWFPLKWWCFRCSGGKSWSLCGHRVWTSYYCAKLVVFPPRGARNWFLPPQTPKILHLGEFHGKYRKWVEFHEMERNLVEFHQNGTSESLKYDSNTYYFGPRARKGWFYHPEHQNSPISMSFHQ